MIIEGSETARVTFHGQRDQFRQSYREGKEDQLGALGLVVNIICQRASFALDIYA